MSYLKQVKAMIIQGRSVDDICCEMGITLHIYSRWIEADRNRRLQRLERENRALKKALAAFKTSPSVWETPFKNAKQGD